jgi:hypothetical protein
MSRAQWHKCWLEHPKNIQPSTAAPTPLLPSSSLFKLTDMKKNKKMGIDSLFFFLIDSLVLFLEYETTRRNECDFYVHIILKWYNINLTLKLSFYLYKLKLEADDMAYLTLAYRCLHRQLQLLVQQQAIKRSCFDSGLSKHTQLVVFLLPYNILFCRLL